MVLTTGATDPTGILALGAGYVSVVKLTVMVVLLIPWFIAAPWVQRDAKRVRMNPSLWSAGVLAAGGGGFALWLLLPLYAVGLAIYVVAVLASVLAYAVTRDAKVSPEEKLLSGAGLAAAFKGGKVSTGPEVEQKVKLYDAWAKVFLPPTPETASAEEIEAYNLLQELMHDVLWYRASEADLVPADEQTRVRFVIDGVPNERPPIPLHDSEALIQYLKPIANMDPEERRRPQTGKIAVDMVNSPVDVDVITAGTTGGQRLRLRVVQELVQTDLDQLGMPEDLLARVREANKADAGLILVSGRQGNGLTSTAYSLLRDHDAFMQHLMTVEAKKAVDLENVTQNEYEETEKLPKALAQTLRRDPDVLLIDRLGDQQSAGMIRKAAGEKTVIATVHAGDSFTALAMYLKACGGEAEALKPLQVVLCQVLLRKLCPTCKEAYKPRPQLLAKANLPAEKIDKFYQATGKNVDEKGNETPCPTCQGSGYFGRTAAFELLEVTDEVRQLVSRGAQLAQIRAAARKNRMLYLQEQAMRKVMEGVTSVKEVIRVTQQSKG